MHPTTSCVLPFGCADSGRLHVHIRRYSQNKHQGYYRILKRDISNVFLFNALSFIYNHNYSKIFIITDEKNKRGLLRLANNSQIVRDLLASVELLLGGFERRFTGRVA